MAEIHPRRMVTIGYSAGKETYRRNTGDLNDKVFGAGADAYQVRLRGDLFFPSEVGIHVAASTGAADDIFADVNGAAGAVKNTSVYLALAYRATMDDYFRIPVRVGPYIQMLTDETTRNQSLTSDETEYQAIGARLSVEPEFILKQWGSNGKVSELTVFADFGCGAGPTSVKSGQFNERGYSFALSYEAGARFKLAGGFLIGLSWYGQKYHISSTDTYRNAVFYGIDDDYQGVLLTAGVRF